MSIVFLLAHSGDGGDWFPHGMPPLHPILVNFTAALVPASLISDVLGRLSRKRSLFAAGWWMLLYAVIVTPFTALAGWLWLRQMGGMDMPPMTIHKWLGSSLAFVFAGLLFWRWRIYRRADGTPGWPYLSCAALVVIALTLQGHLGGKMTFGGDDVVTGTDHGIAGPNDSSGQHSEHGLQWRDHIDLKEKR